MPKQHIDIEQLIADQLSGDIRPEDAEVLRDLMASDENVRKMWDEAYHALQIYKASSFAKDINVDQRFDQFLERVVPEKATLIDNVNLRSRRIWWGAAAALLPLIAVLGWLFLKEGDQPMVLTGVEPSEEEVYVLLGDGQRMILADDSPVHVGTLTLAGTRGIRDSSSSTDEVKAHKLTIHVPKGKTYQLDLPDGTQVKLNADSRLEFWDIFVGDTREVRLSGEAFFEVAKDAERPFLVHTDDMQIQVLGTSFNVKSYRDETAQTSVVTGKVLARSIRDQSKSLELLPGLAAVSSSKNYLTKENFDSEEVLGWLKGIYFFNNERLDQIMTAVNRLSGYEIVISNKDISKSRFSGAYEHGKSISLLLDNITQSSAINYRIENNTVTLY